MGSWFSEREMRLSQALRQRLPQLRYLPRLFRMASIFRPRRASAKARGTADFRIGRRHGKKLGLSRRQFMANGCGMAAAFLAMKEIYGTNVFQVDAAEAHTPELIQARAQSLAGQFVFDVQTHFVRDDFDHKELLGLNDFAAEHWNPKIKDDTAPGLARFKFLNYVKEVYYDSDTQLALLSGAPFDDPTWGFLSNEQIVKARQLVNDFAGLRRLLAHTVITPKQPGWMDEVDKAIEVYKPDSWNPTPSVTRFRRPNSPGDWMTSS